MSVHMCSDRAAFITAGANITDHEAFPGNALPWPPYLGEVTVVEMFFAADLSTHSDRNVHGCPCGDAVTAVTGRGAWRTRVQDCESVGTVYMLPAEVYRQQPGKPAPPIHFPTVSEA